MRWRMGTGLAALAVTAALLAGCAKNGGGGNEVASADGGTGSPGATATPSLDPHEMELKFAQCMREHGIDMPDPAEGEGIRITVKAGQEETLKKAQEACRKYQPGANGGKPDPQMEQKARDYAKCMRDNGVKDFPDPDPNQPGIRINKKQADDPNFRTAQEKCQDILGGLMKGGGKDEPGTETK